MYCSIEEAWPDHSFNKINKNNKPVIYEDLTNKNKTYSLSEKEYQDYQNFLHEKTNTIEHFIDKKQPPKIKYQNNNYRNYHHYDNNDDNNDDNNNDDNNSHDINCDNLLRHLQKCDKCLRKVYMKYNCVGNKNNNLLNMLDKSQKEVLSVVLTGILVIILLQILIGNNN